MTARTLRRLVAALALAAASSCGGATAVMVHLTTPKARALTPGKDFQTLAITITGSGGQTVATTTREMQIGESFPQTISVLPGAKTGPGDRITVTVDAEDTSGSVVSTASASAVFTAGKVVDVTLSLAAP